MNRRSAGSATGPLMNLTTDIIRKLACPPGKRDQLVFDGRQRGLAVRVTSTGGKTYLAQYTIAGQKRRVPLGSCEAISLASAREAAEAVMGEVAKGSDPAAERKEQAARARADAERDRLTLAVLIDTWANLHLARRRTSYAAEATRALRVAFTSHLSKPAEALSRAQVVRVLDRMQVAGRLALANRVAAYGRACFSWHLRRGALIENPFATLPPIGERPKRERVLSDTELAAIWRAAEATPAPFGHFVRIAILTGQRKSEIASMAWDEVSDDFDTWTVPAARSKNGKPHLVPLAEPVCAILRGLPRSGKLVLPGDTARAFQGWSHAKAKLNVAAGISDWRIHDLRRTLATGLQRLGVRLEVTESVLGHIAGSRAGIIGIYQRHEWAGEKRAALEAWTSHLTAIIDGREPAENVIALRQ